MRLIQHSLSVSLCAHTRHTGPKVPPTPRSDCRAVLRSAPARSAAVRSPRQPALADFDPATGRARLSYWRAAEIFTTAGGGWTLHHLRHSRLTHLAEAGVGLPMLMTKSRHTSLAIYAKPTFDAVAPSTPTDDADQHHPPVPHGGNRRSTSPDLPRSP